MSYLKKIDIINKKFGYRVSQLKDNCFHLSFFFFFYNNLFTIAPALYFKATEN